MKHRVTVILLFVSLAAAPTRAAKPRAAIRIDYPEDGSIFPPEITPPTVLWHDTSKTAKLWAIEIDFGDGGPPIRVETPGERLRIGEIDPRAVGPTNEPPQLTPELATAWSWTPPDSLWAEIKRRSVERSARIGISGCRNQGCREAVSRGAVSFLTSKDMVGAPIFYRDVPLMPSELQKGVIKPLAPAAVPLIGWRLRNIGEPASHLLLEGVHSCANCHSFSRDGKTLAMDLDGPQNDKGLYAIASIQPHTLIRNEDLISWVSFRDQPAGPSRIGFMSQVSPDGRYVLTTVGPDKDLARNYYVANFKDYRFLQVFYVTRGILFYYNRENRERHALPGADDPRYVQANGVWSPDGSWIVFDRAEARDAYPEGQKLAEYANDPNETQVQYDLYRIPFNGGRGGTPERIKGASRNGMSNSFPKVSPDGRWIVFVQARNGLLMRPDSQLYIVPAGGGTARRMRCNTRTMNSWHSFSPNGRWLVFSSKARSPYTQMYLTHIDEDGNDSPAILVDNSTAANRAVNIPEFVNVAPGGLAKLDMPAADFYAVFDRAWKLAEDGRYKEAIGEWRTALAMNPDDAKAQNNLGVALAREGSPDEAITHLKKALELNPEYTEVHRNLGMALLGTGAAAEAIPHLRKAPPSADVLYNLGLALLQTGQPDDAMAQFEAVLRVNPKDVQAHNDLGVALLAKRRFDEAARQFRQSIQIEPQFAQGHYNLGNALYMQRNTTGALEEWRRALALATEQDKTALAKELKTRIAAYGK